MSFSYTTEGYMTQQRQGDGSFKEGDMLPVRLPEEVIARLAKDNPSCEEVVQHHYIAAYNLIAMGVFGDPSTQRFRISLSGHANPKRDNTGTGFVKDYVSINIQQL